MKTKLCLFVLTGMTLPSSVVCGQEPETPGSVEGTTDETAHDEIRALRDALTEAVLSGDVERQIALTDEDVVTVWQNNEVVRGHAALREFMEKLNAGNEKVFQGYTVAPTADALTILHGGDTGIAWGRSVPHYRYLGMEFDLENRWTATLVRKGGQWKVAAYHVSANVVDNPLLNAAKSSLYWASALAALAGAVVGLAGSVVLKRLLRSKVVQA